MTNSLKNTSLNPRLLRWNFGITCFKMTELPFLIYLMILFKDSNATSFSGSSFYENEVGSNFAIGCFRNGAKPKQQPFLKWIRVLVS